MKLRLLDCGPSRVGWHRHGLVLLCPQKYAQTYLVEHEGALGGGARLLGSAVHVALAHHYARMRGDEGLLSPAAAIDLVAAGFQDEARHAHAIFNSYVQFWHPEQERQRFDVLEVEHEIEVDIDGEPYTQRIDLIVQDKTDGKVRFWDHKTTGQSASWTAESYQLSGQILGLSYLGQRVYGLRYGGAILNMVSKKPVGAPSDRFFRTAPPAAPGSLAQFENTIRRARALIREFKDYAPEDWPRVLDPVVCHSFGGCDFVLSCRWR